MTGYIETYDGSTYRLPVLIKWSLCRGMGQPCDAFSAAFFWKKGMETDLAKAKRFKAVVDGNTAFYGVVDEYKMDVSENGATIQLSGRGMGALLLDNETEAVQFGTCRLSDILNRYVYPLGLSCSKTDDMPYLTGYTVSSGSSCWAALEGFTQRSARIAPTFSTTGKLILSKSGNKWKLDDNVGISGLEFSSKRYGVISEVLVKNADGDIETVENDDFKRKGGICRRVVIVPRTMSGYVMNYTGRYQIEQSMRESNVLKVTLPKVFMADPGDTVSVQLSTYGISGNYRLSEITQWENGDGCGSELKLLKI